MIRRAILAIVVVAVVIVLVWVAARGRPSPPAVDLVAEFPSAEKRSDLPGAEAFTVAQLGVDGRTRPGIVTRGASRVIWKVTVPNEAVLRAWLAVDPVTWKGAEPLLFRIGVYDGPVYEELLNRELDPRAVAGDRHWVPVSIDLSAYAGRRVELSFKTSNPAKSEEAPDGVAFWGAPAIHLR
jgi:hypothetical protein